MKKIITKQEYITALDIVRQYQKQIVDEYEKVMQNYIPYDENTIVDDLYKEKIIGCRLYNSLRCYLDKKELNIPIKDLFEVKKTELMKFRNFGKGSISELERVFLTCGVVLKYK